MHRQRVYRQVIFDRMFRSTTLNTWKTLELLFSHEALYIVFSKYLKSLYASRAIYKTELKKKFK